MMKKVLITALGTMNGSATVSELRKKRPDYYLIGADINPAHSITASKFVDEFHKFPPSIPDTGSYIRFVLDFCRKNKVDYVYCFIDEEVEAFALHREELDRIGTKACIADTNTIEICHHKDRFQRWIMQNMPEIAIRDYQEGEIQDNDYPLFVKPLEGRASIGCKRIDNATQLEDYKKVTPNFIIQEVVSGEIVSVDIVRNRNTGQLLSLQKHELLRNGNGCGTAIEITCDSLLNDCCKQLSTKLDTHGVINAEFFITSDGPKIIEVNPRLPAGTDFSCLAGLNTVINSMLIAEGEPCEFESLKIGHHYTKRYEAYEM